MTVNYIYNAKGKPEYAVVPYILWESLEKQIISENNNQSGKMSKNFNPSDYCGILKHLNMDVDSEIEKLRSQWTRNIS